MHVYHVHCIECLTINELLKMKANQISALEPTELLVKADSTSASSLKVKGNVISLWPMKRQRQRL